MNREQLLQLPPVPRERVCRCGARVGRSHLEYLGGGRSLPVYVCSGCGLGYRGDGPTAPAASSHRSRKPLPEGGSPENPVLDPEIARRILGRKEGG
ncbi:MAG: hypothetical protein ACYCS9_05040 [Candidatus Dormibacteria bacterium]